MIDFRQISEDWHDLPVDERQQIEAQIEDPSDLFAINLILKVTGEEVHRAVTHAERDQVFLAGSVELFEEKATPDEAMLLAACGVFIDHDSFSKFT